MKVKRTKKPGGVVVDLRPKEAQLPGTPDGRGSVFRLKRILVPVDFSASSTKALHCASKWAEQFKATLVMLHIVEPYIPISQVVASGVDEINAQMRKAALRELAKLQRSIDQKVPTETLLRMGRPYLEIIRCAREREMDLIILSTHGRTGLRQVFLGSTAERVVRHAHCPVLVVRNGETRMKTNTIKPRSRPRQTEPQRT